MEILKELHEIAVKTINPYLTEAIENGKKIIGYLCAYVPEEIFHAAGYIPYRMRAVESPGTTLADTYFSFTNCSYVRHCLSKGIAGDYSFLDGVVFMNGCDHNRRLYDNWNYADIDTDYTYIIDVPHSLADHSLEQYIGSLNRFKNNFENHFKISISDDRLRGSIKIYNKKRSLLARIAESRKQAEVPINGSEFLALMMSITALPVETSIGFLEKIAAGLEGRVVSSADDLRIIVVGNCIEEMDHISLLESSGSIIVADKICNGSIYYNKMIDESGDPMNAIGERYLRRISCPRMMDDFKKRNEFIEKLCKEYNADAIIVDKIEFCTLLSGDSYLLTLEAKKKGFPILQLERELYGGGKGQIKTRVQAFFEKVRNLEKQRSVQQ